MVRTSTSTRLARVRPPFNDHTLTHRPYDDHTTGGPVDSLMMWYPTSREETVMLRTEDTYVLCECETHASSMMRVRDSREYIYARLVLALGWH